MYAKDARMKSWIVITIGLLASWHYTDIASDSVWQNVVCPALVFIFLVSLLIKVAVLFGPDDGRGGHMGGIDGGGGGFGGDGGDC